MNGMQSVKTNSLSILFLDSIFELYSNYIFELYSNYSLRIDFLDMFDHSFYSKYFYKNYIQTNVSQKVIENNNLNP
jgi:hypothetical protein